MKSRSRKFSVRAVRLSRLSAAAIMVCLGSGPGLHANSIPFLWPEALQSCAPTDVKPPQTVGEGNNGRVELECQGAYRVRFVDKNNKVKFIGRCAYDWGENLGLICKDKDGNITSVTWYNEEGHHRSPPMPPNDPMNGHVHDDNTHGKFPGVYERECYVFDVATCKLTVTKQTRPIDPKTWLEKDCWVNNRVVYDGTAPESFGDLVNSSASANSTADGEFNFVNYEYALFTGTATAGYIELDLNGLFQDFSFRVDLLGGETAEEVTLALAELVNANTELSAYGIAAFTAYHEAAASYQLNIQGVDQSQMAFQQQQQGNGIKVEVAWVPDTGPSLATTACALAGVLLLARRRD